ncbi:DUF4112 domain-containing protein [Acuticoccus kandeliae]|uniref:DUF4112 domain-containing protein n=1 Tax=Acuticoccus kandeliae TaxID=2073160 RepID=UPI000D3E7F04|nr:DUF4112 domain-containing protein [Acuticoccus kandeliae]
MARTITFDRWASDRRAVSGGTPSTRELDNLAIWLDSKFSLFGIRFGFDSILGLVPGIGDLVGFFLSSYLLIQAYRMGARKRTIARMAANVAGDTVLGSIPLLGSVFDVMWKANRSNMRILKRELERNQAHPRRF